MGEDGRSSTVSLKMNDISNTFIESKHTETNTHMYVHLLKMITNH